MVARPTAIVKPAVVSRRDAAVGPFDVSLTEHGGGRRLEFRLQAAEGIKDLLGGKKK
jgi:hypothetical protein